MFGLKKTPLTFQRIITKICGEYILAFMHVLLNDFAVYGGRHEHLRHLQLCLERCRATGLSLNHAKCAFDVTSRALLGHIVSHEGMEVDPGKIKAIITSPTPKNAKELSRFLGISDGTAELTLPPLCMK